VSARHEHLGTRRDLCLGRVGDVTRPGRLLARPGRVPGLCGALLIAQLFVLRAVAATRADSVTLFGRALPWGCWFRQHFGLPCPLCGMTRSVVLTLHGQINLALQLNWAGPLLVAGLLLFALALIALMLCALAPRTRAFASRLQSLLRFGANAYAALFLFVLMAHWLFALRAR
jgi:hypothetical protein